MVINLSKHWRMISLGLALAMPLAAWPSLAEAGGLAPAARVNPIEMSLPKSIVVPVHSRRYRHTHSATAARRSSRVVHAPFARVETGRRVVVDAPFAHVYRDRRGRYIRAPFVNIWVPN